MAAFTCSGVPAHSLCTVNPASTGLGGTTSVTVTVATGLATVELVPPRMPWSERMVWLAALLPLGLIWTRKRRGWTVAMLTLLLGVGGCGTSRTVPATTTAGLTATSVTTPSGTSTLVVAGSSAGLVRSVNLTLVVQ